ncbi:MAG: bifunctional pyr operon transcriptional regulator/uracil phosphoribosyltransferase PyrR [Gemmatimonadota bacterium]|nr:bifunctional pyr operon transcriptional regulator/uracil phosphoribosyltransferase PyrR [Gemmatimonadota bacterium]
MTPETARRLLDDAGVEETLHRLATGIAAAGPDTDGLVLIGIRRRGVQLAARLATLLRDRLGVDVPTGSLDITLYRDDLHQIGPRPVIGSTQIPGDVTGRRVVIVDDVLFTGRTARAALNELADFGRPRRIELCVLVDRGGRELPIQADHVGLEVPADEHDLVEVRVPELDGESSVTLVPGGRRP